MSYDLIVPPKAETLSTGFVGGMQKEYRGHVYRAELYAAGWRISKDGAQLRRWDDLPKQIQKYALDAKRVLTESASV